MASGTKNSALIGASPLVHARVAGLVGVLMIAFMFYALLLYGLLKPVDKTHAIIMVGLVVASVPIYMLNQVNRFAALLLAAHYASGTQRRRQLWNWELSLLAWL